MTDEEIIKAIKKMNSEEMLKADEDALENSLLIFDSLDLKRQASPKKYLHESKNVSSVNNKKSQNSKK